MNKMTELTPDQLDAIAGAALMEVMAIPKLVKKALEGAHAGILAVVLQTKYVTKQAGSTELGINLPWQRAGSIAQGAREISILVRADCWGADVDDTPVYLFDDNFPLLANDLARDKFEDLNYVTSLLMGTHVIKLNMLRGESFPRFRRVQDTVYVQISYSYTLTINNRRNIVERLTRELQDYYNNNIGYHNQNIARTSLRLFALLSQVYPNVLAEMILEYSMPGGNPKLLYDVEVNQK